LLAHLGGVAIDVDHVAAEVTCVAADEEPHDDMRADDKDRGGQVVAPAST
jgi:hypothetical protein